MNKTAENFRYPDSLIREYEHWLVLLRPKQPTLGSLILCSKSDATEARQLGESAYQELGKIKVDIEAVLRDQLNAEKINYLMLMMVDPHVHYHVIPRYSATQKMFEREFLDTGWPALPDLGYDNPANPDCHSLLLTQLKALWPK